ncbi:MAG: MG2 domain-containing protein, partial [Syntrophales bacterium]|nr:MG2 domain-containing protein [Syntrophales bacterium]
MESGKQVSGGRIKRAKALLGGHRSWTVFGALLVLLLLAGAGMGESWSKKEAAAKAAFDPAKHFTIEKIEPDAAKEEIRVFFSQPLPLGFLRQHLRLLPRSKVDWNRSTLTDKGVLTLKGTFVYGTTYGIALPGDQKIQKRTYLPTISSFKMPDRPPKVEFVGKKSVIELDSRQLLHVRTQNVGSLLLEEVKLPPVLLPLALAAKKDPESWAPELEVLRKAAGQSQKLVQSQKGLAPFWGQLREQKQLFAAPAEKNKVQAVSLPLTFRQDPKQGLMSLIRVINPQDPKVGTGPRVFRVTDLGLTYKLGQGSLLLWVTSLKTCAPLAGAQVAAISRDLEIFPLGATDKDGILIWQDRDLEGISLKQLGEFTTVKRRVARENLRFLLVAVKGDVSYIELQPQGDLKPVGVWQATGKEQGRTLTGQVFTERGVYRPGEQVFYKGTIREYAGGKITPPAGNMVSFEVRNPKGDQVYSRSLKLSEFGTAAGVIKVEPQWPLGTYTLTLKFGNKAIPPEAQKAEPGADEDDDFLAANQKRNTTECTFQVQEFKPPRHFAEVSFQRFTKSVKDQNQKEAPREFVRIKISGSYYAGGPVKNGQVRWKIYHTKTSFQVPGQDDFTFGCVGEEKGEMLEGGQAVLDEKGS